MTILTRPVYSLEPNFKIHHFPDSSTNLPDIAPVLFHITHDSRQMARLMPIKQYVMAADCLEPCKVCRPQKYWVVRKKQTNF